MPTIIDQLSTAGGSESGFSDSETEYWGQVFTAAGPQLKKIEFPFKTSSGPDSATEFKLLVTTAVFDGNGFHPGAVLFESALIVDPVSSAEDPHIIIVDTGGLSLTPGQKYAFILDAFVASDGQGSSSSTYKSHAGSFGIPDYAGGYVFTLAVSGGNRTSHFAADWGDSLLVDMSFRLTFSAPGVTIVGKKGNDRVDGNDSVGNQPFAGSLDDVITGKGGKDKLSGLAGDDLIDGGNGNDKLDGGDGDDTLTGGKGADALIGGAGLDSFVFNVSPKQPFDKIKGFSIADDTIVLDNASFSLVEGPLAATAFAFGTKAADAAARIIYDSASGKLRYDPDGIGKDKALVFAKVDKGLALTQDDFLVI